jgi:hypothetical protein
MAYRTHDNAVHVACRADITPGINAVIYQDYDLHKHFGRNDGQSNEAPSLTQLDGRLYVFWKSGTIGGQTGDIVFTSSEDGEEWNAVNTVTTSDVAMQTPHAPAVCAYKDRIYLVFINNRKEIKVSSSGQYYLEDWSPARFLQVQSLFFFLRLLMTSQAGLCYESVHAHFGR